jgi:hypothetical protein
MLISVLIAAAGLGARTEAPLRGASRRTGREPKEAIAPTAHRPKSRRELVPPVSTYRGHRCLVRFLASARQRCSLALAGLGICCCS